MSEFCRMGQQQNVAFEKHLCWMQDTTTESAERQNHHGSPVAVNAILRNRIHSKENVNSSQNIKKASSM